MSAAERTRFVVLHHQQGQAAHYDLMVLRQDALATWKFNAPPQSAGPASLDCEKLPDHRTAYLDYEGPISDDRGEVQRCDQGDCHVLHWDDFCVELLFEGKGLRGRYWIRRRHEAPQRWCFEPLGA